MHAALAVVLVAATVWMLAAATYRIPSGTVAFSLRPALPGGRLVLPLGPAGSLALHTHHGPVDVTVDYAVSEGVTPTTAERLVDDLPALQANAQAAFARFLWTKLPVWLLLGAAAGALVATALRRRWRTLALGAALGVAGAALAGGVLLGVSLLTVDTSPRVEYRGLASNVPRLLPMLRELRASDGGFATLQTYVDGLEVVAGQMIGQDGVRRRDGMVRLLVVSDVHDNVYGMRLASRLAAGEEAPVDGVLLVGDVTNYGTAAEAKLFARRFSSFGAPVAAVGGNHENAAAMKELRRAGYHLLHFSQTSIAGIAVYGESDPLAFSRGVESDLPALESQSAELAARLAEMKTPPQVLLVHDERQAAGAVEWARDGAVPLTVVFGNDHIARVERDGSLVLVDAGTGGASGYGDIGSGRSEWYTFQLIDFTRADGRVAAVTTLSYSIDGRSRVEYLPVEE